MDFTELDAIKAEADILQAGRNCHENDQPSSNGNLDEVVRNDTVEHFEGNMADKNTQESEETTPINDPLTEEEKALRDRLKIKFEEAVLIEFEQRRRFKRPPKGLFTRSVFKDPIFVGSEKRIV